jgi:hypothetical protein
MNLRPIKDLVAPGNVAAFVKYHDGQLWYEIWLSGKDTPEDFQFPVPISDIGNATFLSQDKAILFMRYIRKHMDFLKKAQDESKAN